MTSSALLDLFEHPPRDFGPTPLWWWSGARVTSERLRFQLQRFHDGGIHNLVIINLAPAGPIVGGRADDPAWFSDEWWERFEETCAIAEELGMRIWFYDQIGFSGANVQGTITHANPEAAGLALRSHVLALGDGPLAVPPGETLLAVYDAAGGRLDPSALPGAGDIRLVTTAPTAFDYLDPHAVGLLIDTIHRRFDARVPQYLGNVVAGSFQDELPSTNSWTPRFAEEFVARRGYDLLDHLPALWEQGGDLQAKVRGDYFAVRAELTEEALFRPLAEWHTERGMLIGSDQTNPARAGNPTQATQLYTDYFRTHRWYGAAGSDHEGDAKVHSSMAHLYEHERVWIESFHSSGWGGTLEDTYDWLLPFLRSGANLYNPHASYFGTAGGWFEWAPPSTDWRQPYFAQYPAFARAVSRIASIMSWGRYEADVAVLYPTATTQSLLTLDAFVDHFGDGQIDGRSGDRDFAELDETQRHYLELSGANSWFETKPGALDSAGVAFDVIDDDSIQRADAADGRLRLRDLGYSVVLLPSTSVLEAGTASRLIELLDAGGTVVAVGRPPRCAAGRGGEDAVVSALAAHPRLATAASPQEAVEVVRGIRPYASSDVPLLVRRSGADAAALVTAAFPNASAYPLRTSERWLWDDYDFDSSRYQHERVVEVDASVASAEVWDPATGRRSPAEVVVEGEVSRITVRLGGAPAAIVVWTEGERAAASAPRPDAAPQRVDVSDGWLGAPVATMDNRWGDFALPAGAGLDAVQVWSLDGTEEPAASDGFAPVAVTSGQRVLVVDAVAEEDAPAPLSADEVWRVLEGSLPLGSRSWREAVYSASRGEARQGETSLGNKGLVPEEFVRVLAPTERQVAAVRAIVRTPDAGPLDLVVAAGAVARIWWNGEELAPSDGYATVRPIEARAGANVLEYRMGASQNPPTTNLSNSPVTLGSFFTLVERGGWGVRPEFMSVGPAVVPSGRVTYTREFTAPAGVTDARLIVGAATGLSVQLDGRPVARQEKVEYYESSWGATPMYFSHDLTALLPEGAHVLDVVADSADARDVVFVDLVLSHAGGSTAVVSGAGWNTASGSTAGDSVEFRGHWAELISSHAATRTHPLPEVEWMHGAPVIGRPAVALATATRLEPRAQVFRTLLPAGAVEVSLPLRLHATAAVDDVAVELHDGVIRFDPPLPHPSSLVVTTEPTAFACGGAAFSGPLLVRLEEAPIELGPWGGIGLASWSGGVRYRRELDLPAGMRATLDLGRVRGSVSVAVDGEVVGEAFCAPFRFDLGDRSGTVSVEVTVYNTLGPFFHESTPTRWVFPSQLESGLSGPVALELRG